MHKWLAALLIGASVSACSSVEPTICNGVSTCAMLMQTRIKQNLRVEDEYKGKVTRVSFRLDEDSEVAEFSVLKSSGSVAFDSSVEKAVYDSFPLQALLELKPSVYQKLQKVNLTVAPE